MKKGIYLLFVLLLAASLLMGVFACAPKTTAPQTTTAPQKVYTLKYAGYYTPQTPQAQNYDQFFIARAEALSNGRIKFEYYPNQQLGKAADQMDIIGGGAAESGFIILAYFTSMEPMFAGLDLPFIFDVDVKRHMEIGFAAAHHPDFQAALVKHNLKLLGVDCQGTAGFFSKAPLKKLEDFNGKKIRSAGGMVAQAIKALGAAPSSMASSEVYLALQTGVVEGAAIHPESGLTSKWYEVSKYVTMPYISLSGYCMIKAMNLNVWNSLPKDLQDVLLKAGEETEKNELITMPKLEEQSLADLAKLGMDITMVPRQETQRWRDVCKPIWGEWLKQSGAPGQRLYDFITKEVGGK